MTSDLLRGNSAETLRRRAMGVRGGSGLLRSVAARRQEVGALVRHGRARERMHAPLRAELHAGAAEPDQREPAW